MFYLFNVVVYMRFLITYQKHACFPVFLSHPGAHFGSALEPFFIENHVKIRKNISICSMLLFVFFHYLLKNTCFHVFWSYFATRLGLILQPLWKAFCNIFYIILFSFLSFAFCFIFFISEAFWVQRLKITPKYVKKRLFGQCCCSSVL